MEVRPSTVPMAGLDNQTPVAEDIGIGPEETRFTGTIGRVTVSVKEVK